MKMWNDEYLLLKLYEIPRTLKAHVILSGPEHCVKP